MRDLRKPRSTRTARKRFQKILSFFRTFRFCRDSEAPRCTVSPLGRSQYGLATNEKPLPDNRQRPSCCTKIIRSGEDRIRTFAKIPRKTIPFKMPAQNPAQLAHIRARLTPICGPSLKPGRRYPRPTGDPSWRSSAGEATSETDTPKRMCGPLVTSRGAPPGSAKPDPGIGGLRLGMLFSLSERTPNIGVKLDNPLCRSCVIAPR